MDREEFRKYGYAIVDWIAEYMDNIEEYPVVAQVEPGEIARQIPETPPDEPEDMEAIFGDFSRGVALVLRQELRLEVVRWGKPTYGSHLLAAYCRAQFYTLQGGALYRQLKTVA